MTMTSQFVIEHDVAANLVKVTVSGMWDMSGVEHYEAAIHGALANTGAAAVRPNMLLDLRKTVIQTQEVTAALAVVAQKVEGRIKQIAIILPEAALERIQLRRISDTIVAKAAFKGEEEALAWLSSQDRGKAPL
jgi:hypothetical protein